MSDHLLNEPETNAAVVATQADTEPPITGYETVTVVVVVVKASVTMSMIFTMRNTMQTMP